MGGGGVAGAELLFRLLGEGGVAGQDGIGAHVAHGGAVDGRGQREVDAGSFEAEARGEISHGGSGGAGRHVEMAVEGPRQGDASGCAEKAAAGVERGEVEARGRGGRAAGRRIRCGGGSGCGAGVCGRGWFGFRAGGGGAADHHQLVHGGEARRGQRGLQRGGRNGAAAQKRAMHICLAALVSDAGEIDRYSGHGRAHNFRDGRERFSRNPPLIGRAGRVGFRRCQ